MFFLSQWLIINYAYIIIKHKYFNLFDPELDSPSTSKGTANPLLAWALPDRPRRSLFSDSQVSSKYKAGATHNKITIRRTTRMRPNIIEDIGSSDDEKMHTYSDSLLLVLEEHTVKVEPPQPKCRGAKTDAEHLINR